MNQTDIKNAFSGISDFTKEIIAKNLKVELANVISNINSTLLKDGQTVESLCPPPHLMMHAFRLCDLKDVRVVLFGQDPYIKINEAMGLSFSVPKGHKIPPSLRKIYECLINNGLLKNCPDHGDLSNWAKQGVLLLNASLTTILKKSNAHAEIWSDYTDKLISGISKLPQPLIFILLGKFAQEKKPLIDLRRHVVLEWGHPSPLNSANQTDNPKNFKYCTVFNRTNDLLVTLGSKPIIWDPNLNTHTILDREPTKFIALSAPAYQPLDTLWVFTDGGSKANGKKTCQASWAYYVTDGRDNWQSSGLVPDVTIAGELYKSSNNRGELTAIYYGLEYILLHCEKYSFKNIVVVSDSEYSINCIEKWIIQWQKNPEKSKIVEKKNLDIIIPARKLLDKIQEKYNVKFTHVNSHQPEPENQNTEKWFMWKCNDVVDNLCNQALGR